MYFAYSAYNRGNGSLVNQCATCLEQGYDHDEQEYVLVWYQPWYSKPLAALKHVHRMEDSILSNAM